MCVTSNPLRFRPQVQEVCEMSLEMVGTSENRWLDHEYTLRFSNTGVSQGPRYGQDMRKPHWGIWGTDLQVLTGIWVED